MVYIIFLCPQMGLICPRSWIQAPCIVLLACKWLSTLQERYGMKEERLEVMLLTVRKVSYKKLLLLEILVIENINFHTAIFCPANH